MSVSNNIERGWVRVSVSESSSTARLREVIADTVRPGTLREPGPTARFSFCNSCYHLALRCEAECLTASRTREYSVGSCTHNTRCVPRPGGELSESLLGRRARLTANERKAGGLREKIRSPYRTQPYAPPYPPCHQRPRFGARPRCPCRRGTRRAQSPAATRRPPPAEMHRRGRKQRTNDRSR